jgi:hypothetical protein|tara:strand:+ start:3654 stop:3797 length:144 start_codon:yes stop_codon:yes gene_type:complete
MVATCKNKAHTLFQKNNNCKIIGNIPRFVDKENYIEGRMGEELFERI